MVNKTIGEKQFTVMWHVDDLKVSHVNPKVVDKFIEWIEYKYGDPKIGNVKAVRGKRHDYLAMILDYSEEGEAQGLGLIPGTVERFRQEDLGDGERIPHMGWADVKVNDALLLDRMRPSSRFYFVHAYCMKPEQQAHELMRADFAGGFSAAVRKDNVTGVQFHPEKSHQFGIQFLQAWLEGA